MSDEKVVAFVPIKLNNQRFPGKNLVDLGGRPLCEWIFDALVGVKGVGSKYVYCSDESIVKYIPLGLEFLKRPEWLDGFGVKGLDIIGQFIKDVDADIYLLTHATQPFTTIEALQEGLDAVLSGEYDSAFCALELQDYCWYHGKPINYDLKDIIRTQDLEPVFMETGAYFIFRKEVFTEMHQRIGRRPYIKKLDQMEAVDIDTKEDFEFAKAVLSYKKSINLN